MSPGVQAASVNPGSKGIDSLKNARRTQPCAHRDVSPAHLILASWPPEAEEDNFVVFQTTEFVYSVRQQ